MYVLWSLKIIKLSHYIENTEKEMKNSYKYSQNKTWLLCLVVGHAEYCKQAITRGFWDWYKPFFPMGNLLEQGRGTWNTEVSDTSMLWNQKIHIFLEYLLPLSPTGPSPFLCSICLISTYMPSSSTHGGQHPYHPSTLSSLLLSLHTLLWFANDSYYGLWHILIWKPILLIHTPLFKNRSSLLNRELSLVL